MASADAGQSMLQAAAKAAAIANLSGWRRCNEIRILAARPFALVRELVCLRPLFMVNITKF
jgi:hypothetical protein